MDKILPSRRDLDPTLPGMDRRTMKYSTSIKKKSIELLHKDKDIRRYVDTPDEQRAFKKAMNKLKGSRYGVTADDIPTILIEMVKDKGSGFDRMEARKLADALVKRNDIPAWKKRELMRPFYNASTFKEDRPAMKNDPHVIVPDVKTTGASRFLPVAAGVNGNGVQGKKTTKSEPSILRPLPTDGKTGTSGQKPSAPTKSWF
ncbi:MAG: hypothetical protein HGA31_01920 [Candidatus Moranbacteria bacterium]|nr:hypothetical protein [Candidatus Moranbacteria bacterium]